MYANAHTHSGLFSPHHQPAASVVYLVEQATFPLISCAPSGEKG